MINLTSYYDALNILAEALSNGNLTIEDQLYIIRENNSKRITGVYRRINKKDIKRNFKEIKVSRLLIELRVNRHRY